MSRKRISLWLSFTLILGLVIILVEITSIVKASTTWYVDDVPGSGGPENPPEDFTSIQDAINAANPGDTIFVYKGIYFENIVINKTINLTGEDRETSTLDGSGGGIVIYVNAHWVNITNIKVTNGDAGIMYYVSSNNKVTNINVTQNNNVGIHFDSSSGNNISNNHISDNYHAINLMNTSNNNTISLNNLFNNGLGVYIRDSRNNNVYSNKKSGMALFRSSECTFKNNSIEEYGWTLWGDAVEHWNSHTIDTSNTFNGKTFYYYKNQNSGIIPPDAGGVILANCRNIVIENHNFSSSMIGINLGFSNNNIIQNNNVFSNSNYGIFLQSSNYNNISNNNAYLNRWYGILLQNSEGNNITYNNCYNNDNGICCTDYPSLPSSYNNIITYNNIFSNYHIGIYQSPTSGNLIYHNNIINNTIQAMDDPGNNYWDNSYPSGGNYWSDYKGTDDFQGPGQDIIGKDGIGDSPYVIDLDSQDNYPLMNPVGNYIFLPKGWNLIAIPFIQSPTNLDSVLSSISGSYDAVQWYNIDDILDPWKHNNTNKPPHLNDLDALNHKMGFWIYVTELGGVLFQYFGIQPTENQTIALHPGWNMVGYPSLTSYNRTEGLNNLTFDDQVDAIWSYDAATQKWEEMGESDYFQIGRGYYIHAKSECEWEVLL